MATISVVMPIYVVNETLMQLTRDCIFSLMKQYDELIIVDDHSPFFTNEFRSNGTYIRNDKNEGYIKSANKGILAATKDYTCIVCNDTKLLKGNLKDLCGNGIMFPTVEGKAKPFWDGAFYCFPSFFIALYDELFHTYFGDLDKFYRCKLAGIQLNKTDKVEIYHKGSATTETVGIRNTQYDKDHQTFVSKWGFDPLTDYMNII